jgi:hypothetical protein
VVCHNPEGVERDQQVRANLVAYLETQTEGTEDCSGDPKFSLSQGLIKCY